MKKRKKYNPIQAFRGLSIWCTNVKDYRKLVETIDIFSKHISNNIIFLRYSFNQFIAVGKEFEMDCLELALLYTDFSYSSLDNFNDWEFETLIHVMEQAVKDGKIY